MQAFCDADIIKSVHSLETNGAERRTGFLQHGHMSYPARATTKKTNKKGIRTCLYTLPITLELGGFLAGGL